MDEGSITFFFSPNEISVPCQTKSTPYRLSVLYSCHLGPAENTCCGHQLPLGLAVDIHCSEGVLWCPWPACHPTTQDPFLDIAFIDRRYRQSVYPISADGPHKERCPLSFEEALLAFHETVLSLSQSPIALRPSPSLVMKSAVHVVVTGIL